MEAEVALCAPEGLLCDCDEVPLKPVCEQWPGDSSVVPKEEDLQKFVVPPVVLALVGDDREVGGRRWRHHTHLRLFTVATGDEGVFGLEGHHKAYLHRGLPCPRGCAADNLVCVWCLELLLVENSHSCL